MVELRTAIRWKKIKDKKNKKHWLIIEMVQNKYDEIWIRFYARGKFDNKSECKWLFVESRGLMSMWFLLNNPRRLFGEWYSNKKIYDMIVRELNVYGASVTGKELEEMLNRIKRAATIMNS